ncbi:MAG: hypothetical protein IPH12_00500 [Saprospirales bacterium]|nr:hypothetical protein [Saprospirales bacterium]
MRIPGMVEQLALLPYLPISPTPIVQLVGRVCPPPYDTVEVESWKEEFYEEKSPDSIIPSGKWFAKSEVIGLLSA